MTVGHAWAEASPAVRARARWLLTARESQVTPAGLYNVWLYMAGRGAGKTRAAAEDMAYYGMVRPGSRLAIVAPTYADARDTCVEGESGLLACLSREDVRSWNRSLGEMVLRNGTRYKLFSADEPERLRGPQHHRAWCDELAAFRYPESWDMLQMGLRLGAHPQTVVTTTPRPTQIMRDLLARDDVYVTRGTTWDNAANLAPVALEALRRRYEGSRLGRQELEGQLIEDVEGALFSQEWIDASRVSEPGAWLQRTVVGVDPAEGGGGSEQAYTVCALGGDHQLYVMESVAMREPVATFARRCIEATARCEGEMVVEKNHGGAWLREVLESEQRHMGVVVPVRMVSASVGKRVRAEPVAALFQQGRAAMVGVHEELEAQLTSFADPGDPSDRLDSMVWAISDLSRGGVGQSGPAAEPWNAGGALAGGAIAWS